VHRVAAAVEQVLYAPRPQPTAGLGDDVRRLEQGLHAKAGRSARLRATLAPRSAVRVAWSLSQRWADLGSRWTARKSALLRRARRPSGQEG
jgi:hypothetical protein